MKFSIALGGGDYQVIKHNIKKKKKKQENFGRSFWVFD